VITFVDFDEGCYTAMLYRDVATINRHCLVRIERRIRCVVRVTPMLPMEKHSLSSCKSLRFNVLNAQIAQESSMRAGVIMTRLRVKRDAGVILNAP
jgi:hypothetical protein